MSQGHNRLEELSVQIKSYDAQIQRLYTEVSKLQEEHTQTRLALAKVDSTILQQAVWDVKIYTGFESGSLTGIGLSSSSDESSNLAALLEDGYHCYHNLHEGVRLDFNDHEIGLHFETTELAFKFIRDQKLKVSLEEVKAEKTKAETSLEAFNFVLRELS